MTNKFCQAELDQQQGVPYIAQDDYEQNNEFHLCNQPAVDAVDFFGKTVWLCAEHFDVFAPTYPTAF
jgi:hypothetical protein